MEKYSTTRQATDFDWRVEIDHMINKTNRMGDPEIYKSHHHLLTGFAESWVTCACGQQCAVIPRSESGAPKDLLLNCLGSGFYWHIKDEDFLAAINVLNAIEYRSAYLIHLHTNNVQP